MSRQGAYFLRHHKIPSIVRRCSTKIRPTERNGLQARSQRWPQLFGTASSAYCRRPLWHNFVQSGRPRLPVSARHPCLVHNAFSVMSKKTHSLAGMKRCTRHTAQPLALSTTGLVYIAYISKPNQLCIYAVLQPYQKVLNKLEST